MRSRSDWISKRGQQLLQGAPLQGWCQGQREGSSTENWQVSPPLQPY